MDYFETRRRMAAKYGRPAYPKGEALGDKGFLTEVAGRVILTAPASHLTIASQLPDELVARWEKASAGNPHMTWLQGRFVEAEKANRNGAFWTTEDLQFGEMSVTHGPLNWLHEDKTVIGTIADNAMIHPKVEAQFALAGWDRAEAKQGWSHTTNGFISDEQLGGFNHDQLQAVFASSSANLWTQPRPFMAAVSAAWNWVHPEKVRQVKSAADQGKLYYSMECIAREMSCVSDETHEGCDKSFDYIQAMTKPESCCEHIAGRTSARRMVDPTFLGGAVIVPPVQPGWGAANVELVKQQAALLAEQTAEVAGDMTDSQWESLMAAVVNFATARQES